MKAARIRALLFVMGLALIAWGMMPRLSAPAAAAPLMLVTQTSTAEPPTTTPTTVPTPGEQPSATPTQPIIDPGATATPTSTPEPPPPDRPDPTSTPLPTATPTATPAPAPPAPDPAITKSVNPPVAQVGDEVVYTIAVTNLGGSPAAGVVVEDTLPSFLTILSATSTRGTVTVNGQSVRVEIGDLAPGETVEIQIRARVIAPASAPNNVNLAVVSSTTPDSNPDNNQASVPLDATGPISLPNTGDAASAALPIMATLLGLALIAASALVRRRASS